MEVVNLAVEIVQLKQRFDAKTKKQSKLADYLTTYLREKFGAEALRAEVGYNLSLAAHRLATAAPAAADGGLVGEFWRCLDGQAAAAEQLAQLVSCNVRFAFHLAAHVGIQLRRKSCIAINSSTCNPSSSNACFASR